MIHVDRTRVPAPQSLAGKHAVEAHRRAASFFKGPPAARRQLTFTFDMALCASPDVVGALNKLFLAKCAFCESAFPTEVVHLRPPQNSLALDGTVAFDHYWWLAYEWQNLYFSCAACAQVRGTRFPVAAERAGPQTLGDKLDAEQPLLLDPCRDQPEQHLLYLPGGTIVSDDERGRVTIQMFDLNRAPLVEARREMAVRLAAELAEVKARRPNLPRSAIEPLLDPAREFAGMRRQLVAEQLARDREAEQSVADVRVETPRTKGRLGAEFAAARVEQEAFSLDDPTAHRAYFTHARQVERIELRNFRVIHELDIALSTGVANGTRAPWLMLLGENGLGKSTVLQAVCLALLDEKTRDGLGLDASDFVRSGARKATVKVHLTGTPAPIELTARKGSRRFEGGGELTALLLGYGATRLLPTPKHPAPSSPPDQLARVENLFDPFAPIGDATSWLLTLDDKRFDDVALALRQLLMLSDEQKLVRDRKNQQVVAQGSGMRVRLEVLSAGYQSVIALATDVMRVVLRLWDSPTVAEGIVVIDEMGAHLHPRWRMRIVGAVRTVFPRLQVLASTHDPLCLRGLGDGEVAVLRRNSEGRVVALDDLPPPSGMRVDQLLASEHFGLGSTVDPEIDALFAEYYLLKAKRRPNAREAQRLGQLHAELDGRQLVGTTRRERLIYEATDEFLAREVDLTSRAEREALKEETKDRIRAAWEGAAR